MDYDESLRIDCVNRDIETLRTAIEATMQPDHNDVNSLVKLLGISKAELPKNKEVSADTALILSSIRDLSERLANFEQIRCNEEEGTKLISPSRRFSLPTGETVSAGYTIYNEAGGTALGELIGVASAGVIIRTPDNNVSVIAPNDPTYNTLSAVPF